MRLVNALNDNFIDYEKGRNNELKNDNFLENITNT